MRNSIIFALAAGSVLFGLSAAAQDDPPALQGTGSPPLQASAAHQMNPDHKALYSAWSAQEKAAYDGWAPDHQAYFWKLSPQRQTIYWRLSEADRATLAAMDEPDRETAWIRVERQAADGQAAERTGTGQDRVDRVEASPPPPQADPPQDPPLM